MSYFKHHVFFCCNQRAPGESCCNALGASELQTYAKDRIAQLKMKGAGKVRINKAGCLDRCDQGPVMVIYPEAVWYTYVDKDDVEEIIQELGEEKVRAIREYFAKGAIREPKAVSRDVVDAKKEAKDGRKYISPQEARERAYKAWGLEDLYQS